jgi:hypothetical protein
LIVPDKGDARGAAQACASALNLSIDVGFATAKSKVRHERRLEAAGHGGYGRHYAFFIRSILRAAAIGP